MMNANRSVWFIIRVTNFERFWFSNMVQLSEYMNTFISSDLLIWTCRATLVNNCGALDRPNKLLYLGNTDFQVEAQVLPCLWYVGIWGWVSDNSDGVIPLPTYNVVLNYSGVLSWILYFNVWIRVFRSVTDQNTTDFLSIEKEDYKKTEVLGETFLIALL